MITPQRTPNYRHSAILRPQFTKCARVREAGQHAYVKTKEGYQQCVECGNIKSTKERRAWHTQTPHSSQIISKGL